MRLFMVVGALFASIGLARADQTVTLETSQLTLTLPGNQGDWQVTKVDSGDGAFDMLSWLVGDRALAFSAAPYRPGCGVFRNRAEARSTSTFWPSDMVVFQAVNANSITEKTCLSLARGAFLFMVTHAKEIDELSQQQILAVLDAITYAGGGAGSGTTGSIGVDTAVNERVYLPGTGLSIMVPGGAAAWTVTTRPGIKSQIDYLERKDASRPWFQISTFRFFSPASCASWERAARRDGERLVARPAYSPVPYAYESRARKDGHFVGTSCLRTRRGEFLVLFEYRGANDHDEDALARAATESLLDSAGGSIERSSSSPGTSNSHSSKGSARLRILEAGFTQIRPSEEVGLPMRDSGSGVTLGYDSIALGRSKSAVLGAGQFETRWGYDSVAGITGDVRLGLGLGFRLFSGTLLVSTVGAGYDAIGLGQEEDPMKFKANGAFYVYFQGQLVIVATRTFGLTGTVMFANRIGDNNGGEERYGANLFLRRSGKSDLVLGIRYHDYALGSGASALTASIGLGY